MSYGEVTDEPEEPWLGVTLWGVGPRDTGECVCNGLGPVAPGTFFRLPPVEGLRTLL